jgi:hypothetical protein
VEREFPRVGQPALRALRGAGYTRLEPLTRVTELELNDLHSLGPKAIGLLREALALKNLTFKLD